MNRRGSMEPSSGRRQSTGRGGNCRLQFAHVWRSMENTRIRNLDKLNFQLVHHARILAWLLQKYQPHKCQIILKERRDLETFIALWQAVCTKHFLLTRDIPAYMSVVVPLSELRYWNKQQQWEESGI
jgi:hypothetical protein